MTDTQSRDPNFVTTEFLALLLNQIETVYRENTDDYASIHALDIAIAAIEADMKWDDKLADALLENMAALASWFLGWEELSPAIRARFQAISNTHPEFAETATAVAE